MNKPVSLATAALLALAACNGPASTDQAPLAGARIGGPFSLLDQDGRRVTDRSWPGKWRAIYFGYSYCPDVCPTDLMKLMKGYAKFAAAHPDEAAKLQPIFISIDPARDTPAVVKQFVTAFGSPLIGLTGSEQQVADVTKGYGVLREKREEPGASGYLMDHSRQTVLFDPAGRPIALLPTDADADQVAAELARWVR